MRTDDELEALSKAHDDLSKKLRHQESANKILKRMLVRMDSELLADYRYREPSLTRIFMVRMNDGTAALMTVTHNSNVSLVSSAYALKSAIENMEKKKRSQIAHIIEFSEVVTHEVDAVLQSNPEKPQGPRADWGTPDESNKNPMNEWLVRSDAKL